MRLMQGLVMLLAAVLLCLLLSGCADRHAKLLYPTDDPLHAQWETIVV